MIACAGLLGCGPRATEPPSDQADPAGQVQQTLDRLAVAVQRRDRAAFEQHLSTTDPGFAPRARELYDNLAALPLDRLQWRAHGSPQQLGAIRGSVLPDAWMQAVTVEWRLRPDSGPATHELWWTFELDRGRALLAGVTDAPGPRAAQPIWLLEPIEVVKAGVVTSLEHRRSGTRWAEMADAAVTQARARLPEQLTRRWNGHVVLEIPNSEQHFLQIVGRGAGRRSSLAAIAFPMGPDPSTAAIRIVINPDPFTRLSALEVNIVLLHEVTHVLTHAADSPAPLWLVEGYADWVAYDVHRSAQPAAEAPLRQLMGRLGLPPELPGNDAFQPGGAEINATYAHSWLVCRYIAEAYSPQDLGELYVKLDRGGELGNALEEVLGVTAEAFTDGWRNYLDELRQR